MDANDSTTACTTEGKKTCCVKGFILPVIAVFATIFGFEWAFHGIHMMPYYEATAELWRDQATMESLFHISLIRQAVTAVLLVLLYCWISKGCCCGGGTIKVGATFGLLIGLLLGIWDFGAYAWLPVPISIPLHWLGGSVIMGITVGVVLAFFKRCCK